MECIYKDECRIITITDIWHCMLHLHTHATLYSVCRLVVPSGNEKLLDICLADVSFFLVLENPESVCRAKRM